MGEHLHEKYCVLSLFSGCGGGDLGLLGGFEFLGKTYPPLPFQIMWANDIDESAASVYKQNLGGQIHRSDIALVSFKGISVPATGVDVLVAGFPCQDFSLSGSRQGLSSARGQLYKQVRRALRHFQPKLFLAENVPGIEYPTTLLATIKRGLEGRKTPKYRGEVYHVNAADYGVPQLRNRLLIVGIREDITIPFTAPKPTNFAEPEAHPKWITSKMALEDLWDSSGPGSSKVPDQAKLTRATIVLGKPKRRDRLLNPGQPAPTVRAQHHGHIEVHYNVQADGTRRRLTIRECARLQSFPDTFTFPTSATKGYVQIGNAMPPVMIHRWGTGIVDWLNRIKSSTNSDEDKTS